MIGFTILQYVNNLLSNGNVRSMREKELIPAFERCDFFRNYDLTEEDNGKSTKTMKYATALAKAIVAFHGVTAMLFVFEHEKRDPSLASARVFLIDSREKEVKIAEVSWYGVNQEQTCYVTTKSYSCTPLQIHIALRTRFGVSSRVLFDEFVEDFDFVIHTDFKSADYQELFIHENAIMLKTDSSHEYGCELVTVLSDRILCSDPWCALLDKGKGKITFMLSNNVPFIRDISDADK